MSELATSLRIPKLIKPNPNEPYDLRYINPSRSSDTQAMRDIDRHPNATRFTDPSRPLSNKEFDELVNADLTDTKEPVLLLAITDKISNEIVGWVEYYPDDQDKINAVGKQITIPSDALVLQVSYSKSFSVWQPYSHFIKFRDNLPKTQNMGVAISGVKQSLPILVSMESTISASTSQPARHIVVTAYTDPTNKASEAVLIKTGFTKLRRKINYDGELNNAWIKQLNPLD